MKVSLLLIACTMLGSFNLQGEDFLLNSILESDIVLSYIVEKKQPTQLSRTLLGSKKEALNYLLGFEKGSTTKPGEYLLAVKIYDPSFYATLDGSQNVIEYVQFLITDNKVVLGNSVVDLSLLANKLGKRSRKTFVNGLVLPPSDLKKGAVSKKRVP